MEYMNVAIEEALKSLKNGDIPVGALIIKDNEIISRAHNEKELKKNSIMHAEIIAIQNACQKIGSWHLDNCILVTTMEPCMMCCGAIIQSRIKKIIYGVNNTKYGFSKYLKDKYNVELIKYEQDQDIVEMLQNFFKEKR